jgi:FBD
MTVLNVFFRYSCKLMVCFLNMKVKLENEISQCTTFNNLKFLEIDYWDVTYDMDLVVFFLKNSPYLEDLTLCLFDFEVISLF